MFRKQTRLLFEVVLATVVLLGIAAAGDTATDTFTSSATLLPTTLSWNWTDINSTITHNWTRVCTNTSYNLSNCTFTFNATSYSNITNNANICRNITLAAGNYTVNATCYDSAGNNATIDSAWVRYSPVVYNGTLTNYSFTVPAAGLVGIAFVASWAANTTSVSELNVTLLAPANCSWALGSNASYSPANGSYSNFAMFSCSSPGTYTFNASFVFTNSSGTFTQNATDSINISAVSGGGGGGGFVPTPAQAGIIPQLRSLQEFRDFIILLLIGWFFFFIVGKRREKKERLKKKKRTEYYEIQE